MSNIKNLANNDLSELQTLTYRIQELIENFSHVSELLPKQLTDAITDYRAKLQNERFRREDLD